MGHFVRPPRLPVLFFSSSKGKKDFSGENLKDSLLEEEDMVAPKGFLAVYVGVEMRRHVIPTSYLCFPAFQTLMERVAEEFGYEQTGGLRIPCEEEDFQQILRVLQKSDSRKNKKKKAKNSLLKS
ncbi:auxin-induced protein 15A-like [Phoenix dactylifera]|uniref:Auxin-induced protein 15A-like n=1 Tax=Phoenix dactylifera TaxID=42345 RepID=A0A8B7CFQ7_PHODC|nr:auxin-induced protein 15A-like [Phoenix dactylifera]